MKLIFDIIRLSKTQTDATDYNSVVFKVTVARNINVDNCKTMNVFLQTLIDGGGRKFIIDMSVLEFIDSAGLGIIINVAKILRTQKGDIICLSVSNRVLEIFDVINLQKFIKVFSDEKEAVNYLKYV